MFMPNTYLVQSGLAPRSGRSFVSAFTLLFSILMAVLYLSQITAAQIPAAPFDFDGDHKSDIAVFRQSTIATWYFAQNNGVTAINFGLDGDQLAAADYDGDGKTDIAIFRNGEWWQVNSSNGTVVRTSFGLAGDIPIPAQFDNDAKADIAVYRPVNGTWHWLASATGTYRSQKWGLDGDIPVPADYDGDGIADWNVFRPLNSTWYRLNSSNWGVAVAQFGLSNDEPIVADFDGDKKTDITVWRPSTGQWFWINSSNWGFQSVSFGLPGDVPVQADYDGDGKTDVSVFRESNATWYRVNSSNNTYSVYQFGLGSDTPVPEGRKPRRSTSAPDPTPIPSPMPTATPTQTPVPTATPTPVPIPTPPPPPATFTCDYYASPTGSSSGTGTSVSPWDLQTGLSKTALVTNGKTLCLKGGTYRGKFMSKLNAGGIVRSGPGEWAIIDGFAQTTLSGAINSTQMSISLASTSNLAVGSKVRIDNEIVSIHGLAGNVADVTRGWDGTSAASHSSGAPILHAGNQFVVNGSNATYRDFEVTNSSTNRDAGGSCCGIPSIMRGAGIVQNNGGGNNYINLVVHDNYDGFFIGSSTSNTLIYGCLIYNNGANNPPSGHGLYLENSSGYSRIYETLSLNAFNLGIQAYGVTGPYVGGDFQGVVVANAGRPVNEYHYNMIYGPASQTSPTGIINESHFYHTPNTNSYSLNFGYGAGVTTGTVTNNYFYGSGTAFQAQNVANLTFTGNKFYTTGTGESYAFAKRLPYTWNNNSYYNSTSTQTNRLVDLTTVSGLNWNNWKTIMGFDSQSIITTSPLPDTVIVRPNAYAAGRANVIVYAPSGATSVNVNLSTTGLTNGQPYTIKNAFNWNGPDVLTGVYSSASPIISLQLNTTAATVATPIGLTSTPATTCPKFCVMIVRPS